ncbi:MAG: hypothetical protein CBR30_03745 [Dictyoglomus sp. NZ13-RE01]|nr:MAG: hypothetical protein CBR30_03745 [Dictyoglomus sp. NZ13-RE01]
MKNRNYFLINFIIFWLFFYTLFAERFVLKIESGGRGIIPILVLINFLLVFYILLKSRGKVLKVFKSRFFMLWWPFLLLTLLLPILGILINGYPIRTILNLNVLSDIFFVIIGYWIAKEMDFLESMFTKYLVLAIILEFLYSFIQFLNFLGYLNGNFIGIFLSWDIYTQQLYSFPIFGRSIGTFINPNILGFWSVTVFGLSLYLIKGWLKYLMLILSFFTLILSQSRGCLFGLLFAIVIMLIINLLAFKKINFMQFLSVYIFLILIMLIMIFSINFDLIKYLPIERFKNGFSIFLYGASVDQNFFTRVEVWKQSIWLFKKYPLGTLGPPEFVLKTAVDNDWIRLLLQGGIIYVVSFLIMVFAGILVPKSAEDKFGKFLFYVSLTFPIIAISETLTTYRPMAIYWYSLGLFLRKKRKLY